MTVGHHVHRKKKYLYMLCLKMCCSVHIVEEKNTKSCYRHSVVLVLLVKNIEKISNQIDWHNKMCIIDKVYSKLHPVQILVWNVMPFHIRYVTIAHCCTRVKIYLLFNVKILFRLHESENMFFFLACLFLARNIFSAIHIVWRLAPSR